MASDFPSAFHKTVGIEGDYYDDPVGGPTRYGITERVARANGYLGDMRHLPLDEAYRIAKLQYWDVLRLDDVPSRKVASELFDTAYNMGVAIAGRFLQRSLNALNREETDYPDLEVDGVVGPVTISALRSFLTFRDGDGELVLLRALNSLQGAREIELAEAAPIQERFTFGRILNRVTIDA